MGSGERCIWIVGAAVLLTLIVSSPSCLVDAAPTSLIVLGLVFGAAYFLSYLKAESARNSDKDQKK